MGRWNGDYPDADTFAYALHSQGGFLGRFCGSAELDRLGRLPYEDLSIRG